MVLDFELRAEFSDHSFVEVGTIACDDSLGDAIPADKIFLMNWATIFLVTEANEIASTYFVK